MPSITINVNGTIATIPCDSNKIVNWDLVGFTDPFLSLLKAAYERDKNNIIVIPNPVPQVQIREIDARRLRLALSQLSKLSMVESAITTLGEAAKIDWEYATFVREDYPLVTALSTNLGLDVNAIFTLASSLQ